MKCPNCGEENAEGMKFCGNCGTMLPEPMKHCPNCNRDWPLTMKFCGECGFKFGGGSAAGSKALMGDKNVIAGDINNTVSHVDNSSTVSTTYVTNSDETRKVKKCHICGSLIPITAGFECPECHEFVCPDCYDQDEKLCKTCKKKKVEETIAKTSSYITTTEKIDLQRAKDLFYGEGDFDESHKILSSIWRRHPEEEEVLRAFVPIVCTDSELGMNFLYADEWFEEYPYLNNSVSFALGAVLWNIKNNDLDMAERAIEHAKEEASPEDMEIITYHEILLNVALFRKYENSELLSKATAMAENFPPTEDKLNKSWQLLLTNILNKCKGDDLMEFDKDFCAENNLYYYFVNSDVFAFGINTSMDFVTVEGGTYTMGNEQTPAECRLKATVGDMYVCKHPVTQKEYSYIMGKGSCIVISGGEFPVTYITWYDAIEYCNKRSVAENFTPYYNIDKEHKTTGDKNDEYSWTITENKNSDGYRLPTQEEWEYVARGGKLSKGYKFAGSNVLDEVAFTGFHDCPEICQKKPNELGIYDMGGLVSEFCYPRRIFQYNDETSWFLIQIRGNSFVEIHDESSSGSRSHEANWYVAKGMEASTDSPHYKYEFYGFRVVRSKLR